VATFDGSFAPTPEPEFPAAEDLRSAAPFGDEAFGELSDPDGVELAASGAAALRLFLLADPAGEQPAVTRVRTAAATLAAVRGVEVSEIGMDPGEPLLRLASTVQLLDYATVYLGIACGIDPLAIAAIKDLQDLAERSVPSGQ
jgi:hypothetical protein